jgi:hypothetical protein
VGSRGAPRGSRGLQGAPGISKGLQWAFRELYCACLFHNLSSACFCSQSLQAVSSEQSLTGPSQTHRSLTQEPHTGASQAGVSHKSLTDRSLTQEPHRQESHRSLTQESPTGQS